MKNLEKGFIGIAIIIILAIVAIVGGAYIYNKNKVAQEMNDVNDQESTIENKITTEGTTNNDSQVKKPIVIYEDELNKAVAQKYGGNSAAINKQIKVQAQASFSSFVVEAAMIQATDGNFSNVCTNAKTIIKAGIQKSIDRGGAMTALGITINSFNVEQIMCKAKADNFIIAMPITLEDGIAAKICSTESQLGFVGDANFDTYTCIKK